MARSQLPAVCARSRSEHFPSWHEMLQYSLNMAFPGFSVGVVAVAFISAFILCELLAHLEGWLFTFFGPSLIRGGYKKVWFSPDSFVQSSHCQASSSSELIRKGPRRALCGPNAKQSTHSGFVAKTHQRVRKCSQRLSFACCCI